MVLGGGTSWTEDGKIRIANNSPPSKVPHPIHHLNLFANSLSIPKPKQSTSLGEKKTSQITGLPDPPDGPVGYFRGGLLFVIRRRSVV